MSATAPPRPTASKGSGGGGSGGGVARGPAATAIAVTAPPIPAAMPLSIVELCGKHSGR